jgi:two-component system nitrogen regulation response regulator GlnG
VVWEVATVAGQLVLVVDDDEALRSVVGWTVRDEFGAAVLDAADVPTALGLVRASPPDAVVLDLKLPGADGYAFLERLAEVLPGRDVPVVALTAASNHAEARARFVTLGCAGFLRKPFDLADLIDILAPFLRRPAPGAPGASGAA